jgi:hypothetical protein
MPVDRDGTIAEVEPGGAATEDDADHAKPG